MIKDLLQQQKKIKFISQRFEIKKRKIIDRESLENERYI